MRSRSKKIALAFIKFGIPVCLLGWLLFRIDQEQWNALREQPKNYWLLVVAWLTAFGALLLSFSRWAVLLRSLQLPIHFLDAIRLNAIGFLLSFVSAGSVGGDLFKAVFVAKKTPGQRVEAVASIFVDRAVGLYGLLLVGTTVLLAWPPEDITPEFRQLSYGAALLTLVGTIALGVLVLGGRWIDGLLRKFSTSRGIGKWVHRIADPLRLFHSHPWTLFITLLMSVGVHSGLSLSIFLIARSFYVSPPTLGEHFVIVPAGLLASALPISPAGLGVFEAALAWLYEIVPAVPTQASGTLVAITFEVVRILLAGVGLLFYWLSGTDVRTALEEAAEDESSDKA